MTGQLLVISLKEEIDIVFLVKIWALVRTGVRMSTPLLNSVMDGVTGDLNYFLKMIRKLHFLSNSLPCGEQQTVQNNSFTCCFIMKRTYILSDSSQKRS